MTRKQVGGTDPGDAESALFKELASTIVTRVVPLNMNKQSFRLLLIGVAANHACEAALITRMLAYVKFETIDIVDYEMEYQGAKAGSMRKAQEAILDICLGRGHVPNSKMYKVLIQDFDPATSIPVGSRSAPSGPVRPYDMCVYSSGDAQMFTAPNLLLPGTIERPIVADLGLVFHSVGPLAAAPRNGRGARDAQALAFFYFEPVNERWTSWKWPELETLVRSKEMFDRGVRVGNRLDVQGLGASWLNEAGEVEYLNPSGYFTEQEQRAIDAREAGKQKRSLIKIDEEDLMMRVTGEHSTGFPVSLDLGIILPDGRDNGTFTKAQPSGWIITGKVESEDDSYFGVSSWCCEFQAKHRRWGAVIMKEYAIQATDRLALEAFFYAHGSDLSLYMPPGY